MWYKLDSDNNPIPCSSIIEYQEWVKKHGTTVAESSFLDTGGEKIQVSTVFLGLDHSYNSTIPILWETMVFGGLLNQEQQRYASFQEALKGHNEVVDYAKKTINTKQMIISEEDLFKNVLKAIKDVK